MGPASTKSQVQQHIKCHMLIILSDDALMIPYHALHAIDRLLRDLMQNDVPFGGSCWYLVMISDRFYQLL